MSASVYGLIESKALEVFVAGKVVHSQVFCQLLSLLHWALQLDDTDYDLHDW